MKAEMDGDKRTESRHKYFLTAEAILKYLLQTSERISTMIMCKDENIDLTTTDYELYQAIGSVQKYDTLTRARLVKFLENVDVFSYRQEKGEKRVLTHDRVEELRKLALGKALDEDKLENRNGGNENE